MCAPLGGWGFPGLSPLVPMPDLRRPCSNWCASPCVCDWYGCWLVGQELRRNRCRAARTMIMKIWMGYHVRKSLKSSLWELRVRHEWLTA